MPHHPRSARSPRCSRRPCTFVPSSADSRQCNTLIAIACAHYGHEVIRSEGDPVTSTASAPVPAPPSKAAACKETAAREIERRAPQLLALSHAIHADPELSWAEHNAARRVADVLEQ